MESALLGIVLDSSAVIAAERKKIAVLEFLTSIRASWGPTNLCLSPVTVAELVHGIYRAKTPEIAKRRREFIEELIRLVPVHPLTEQSGWLLGQIDGEQSRLGNVLPFNDLAIGVAALEQGYAVLTGNVRHFGKIPGLVVLQA